MWSRINLAKEGLFSKVIMLSERLKDVFVEMDTSCDLITFSISPQAFTLSTSGSAGESTSEVSI
jgi:hypothetical protein